MKLRKRIIILFSVTFLVIFGIALAGVFLIASYNRQQEFYQRLKDKTITTLKLLKEVREDDKDLVRVFDDNIINHFYDEKIVVFDANEKIIYTSVDDTPILFPENIIKRLKIRGDEVSFTEKGYEVVAQRIVEKGKVYYAIGKAYDKFGKKKLNFLGWGLVVVFFLFLLIMLITTDYLAKKITKPITDFIKDVDNISINNIQEIPIPATKDEIASLANSFNNLTQRVKQSLIYQKNFTHHVSHELKTPLAVLVSNIEKSLANNDTAQWKESLLFQKNGLMQIGSIINTLLEIAKYESRIDEKDLSIVRMDELIFEIIDRLSFVYPATEFKINIEDSITNADSINAKGNEAMLSVVLHNLLKNAADYSFNNIITINISLHQQQLQVVVSNDGPILTEAEQKQIFQYFFRGENSGKIKGLGLGLVMANRIIQLHNGVITYHVGEDHINCFMISLPVS